MAPRPRLLAPLLLLALGFAPGAAALEYEGPGQTGTVRFGDGGASLAAAPHLPAEAADALTTVRLQGVPADACRLILDQNATYAATRVAWALNDTVAFVYADVGVADARFRIQAVWHRDLNGRCTAEETATGTIWHDPRGRPYVDLRLVEPRLVLDPMVGTTVHFNITLTNDGTVPDNVTGRLVGLREGWSGGSAGATTAVTVGPLANVSFPFRVEVPADEKPRGTLVRVAFTGQSNWSAEATVLLRLQADPDAPPVEDVAPRPGGTPDAAPVPQWTPPAEAPAPAVGLLLAALGAVALRRRQRA